MNRDIFFAHVRKEPFSGRMTQSQVSGLEALLNAWSPSMDVRWLAYILATVFHETGARMVPVREGFAKSDAQARRILSKYPYAQPDPETGQAYYGRGLEQLTHKANYAKMGEWLGLDLVSDPDLMLRPDIAARSLFLGMTNGLYTGKKLADYFNARKTDPVGARRIVNGTDRAALIAGYYHAFVNAIREANEEHPAEPEPAERETPAPRYKEEVKPLAKSQTIKAQGLVGTGTVGATAAEQIGDGITQAQDAASQLAMYLDIAKWAFIALILAGVAWTVWLRYQDYRKGVK